MRRAQAAPTIFALLFGDEPEIPGSPPADDILGYGRNHLRRRCIGFVGRDREEIPQYLEVILDSRTDHKIEHETVRYSLRPKASGSPFLRQRRARGRFSTARMS